MLSTASLHPRNRRLRGADFFCYLRLRESLLCAGLQEFIQEREFVAQLFNRRAQADAAHKLGLIQAAANKGPKAMQAAAERIGNSTA